MIKVPVNLLFVTAFFCVAGLLSANAASKPNILFIFADDQCFDTIYALGNKEIETPNLDKLVSNGTTFTHAYNQGSWSGAVCVASRHMLNMGLYVWHAKDASDQLGGGNKKNKKKDDPKAAAKWPNFVEKGWFWSQLMEKAGYDTYFTGKWHVRAKPEEIFNVTSNIRGGMPNQTPEGYNRPIEGQPDPWSPYDPKFEGFWKGGRHWSEVVADDAEGFLAKASESNNPFFMYIAFNAPHDPRQAPKEYVDKYPLEKIAIPKNFVPEYPFNEPMDSGRKLRDEKLAPFPRTEYAVKVNRQEYYAIITHMDAQIGRILATLESTGQADDTYIFYSADHGLAVGQHGLMGKQNMFDHSVRVPLMVNGPGVEKGKRITARVHLQDIMPSTLELAGAEIPGHVQFKSLMPLVNGKTEAGEEAIYGAYLGGQRAVTSGPYKMILYPKVPKVLLFNIAEDPLEMKDLSEDPEMKPTIAKLFGNLLELQKETGDTMDLREVFPEIVVN